MGIILTNKYSLFYKNNYIVRIIFGLINIPRIMLDIHRKNKYFELLSFLIWEICYNFKIFSPKKYIQFNNNNNVSNSNILNGDFDPNTKNIQYYNNNDINLIKSKIQWSKVFVFNSEKYGVLTNNSQVLYKNVKNSDKLIYLKYFPFSIQSLFISSDGSIFVCSKGIIYKSNNDGKNFKKVLNLSSPNSFFRFNNGMTETKEHLLFIGEYGNIAYHNNWKNVANLYFSFDYGETWIKSDVLKHKGVKTHVHLVKFCKKLNKLIITDGDNLKKIWICDTSELNCYNDIKLNLINKHHIQLGGYTSMVEIGDNIIFGSDYLGGTNYIVKTNDMKTFEKNIIPDLYRRSMVINLILRKSGNNTELWANLFNMISDKTRSLIMYSLDKGKNWNKFIEYNGLKYNLALISSSNKVLDTMYLYVENRDNKKTVTYELKDL